MRLFLIIYRHRSLAFYMFLVWCCGFLRCIILIHKNLFLWSLYLSHGLLLCLQTALSHDICGHSLLEWNSFGLCSFTVSLKLASIVGSPHVYRTRLLAFSQIVKCAIFTAFVLRYCCSILGFPRWLRRYPALTPWLFIYDSMLPKLCN